MQARTINVMSLDNVIAGGSALGAFGAWLFMSFLQSAANFDFSIIEKLTGAGGTAALLFFLLRWALKRNDEQQKKLNEIHEERIKELKEIIKAKHD
jgi:membrane associated rhomboid family serine protease